MQELFFEILIILNAANLDFIFVFYRSSYNFAVAQRVSVSRIILYFNLG